MPQDAGYARREAGASGGPEGAYFHAPARRRAALLRVVLVLSGSGLAAIARSTSKGRGNALATSLS
jgi:hypothetical protein